MQRVLLASVWLPALLSISHALPGRDQRIKVKIADYATLGNPTSAIETQDGRYAFVSVTNVGAPNFTVPDAAAGSHKGVVSGIQVFRVANNKLTPYGFIRTGSEGANGLVLLRGGKTLVVGIGDEGIAFLNVRDVLNGNATPTVISQGEKAGTFDIVATPDGRYIFAANEYGVIDGQRGSVGVIATDIDEQGLVHDPKPLRQIPVGDVAPSLTLSHDGQRVYVATELVPSNQAVAIAGEMNPILTRSDCVQKKGTPARGNGFISVINVGLATETSPTRNPILARVAAGCSPVRLAESADGASLFVTARGDNAVLQYNAAILATDSEHSFLRANPSGGDAPVGLRLFDHDRLIAVANSNRFADTPGNLAILTATNTPAVLERLPAGLFPRNISDSTSDGELLLTNYTSRTLSLIRVRSLSDLRP
jgi:DNA-binding beta-propeller fold protein YncE